MSPQNQSKVVVVLRWIAFLPAALLASTFVHLLVIFLNEISMARFVDPESILARVYIHLVANIAFGAVAVWVAAYVAPTYKKHVGVVMAGLLLSGAVILWSLMQARYWDVYAMVCTNIGSIGMAIHLFTEDQPETAPTGWESFQQPPERDK